MKKNCRVSDIPKNVPFAFAINNRNIIVGYEIVFEYEKKLFKISHFIYENIGCDGSFPVFSMQMGFKKTLTVTVKNGNFIYR